MSASRVSEGLGFGNSVHENRNVYEFTNVNMLAVASLHCCSVSKKLNKKAAI